MTPTDAPIQMPPSADRVWDGTLEDMDLINSWIEQERIRVVNGGKTHLEGEKLEKYRQAAAMMIPLHL